MSRVVVCDICKKEGKLVESFGRMRVRNQSELTIDYCKDCCSKIPKDYENYKRFVNSLFSLKPFEIAESNVKKLPETSPIYPIPNDTKSWAEAQVKSYLGPDWKLKHRRMRRQWGNCSYNKKCITMSERLLGESFSFQSYQKVLFHEIAHGLAGPMTGHRDRQFRSYCEMFGTHSSRCINL